RSPGSGPDGAGVRSRMPEVGPGEVVSRRPRGIPSSQPASPSHTGAHVTGPVPPAVRRRRARRRVVAMPRLAAVRTQLGLLALVRPAAADALVLRLWCTPPRPPARPEIDGPGAGKVVRLDLVGGGRAVAEAWGDGPPVYLV